MAELMVGSRVDGIKPTLEIAWMLHPPTSNNQETVSKKKYRNEAQGLKRDNSGTRYIPSSVLTPCHISKNLNGIPNRALHDDDIVHNTR